MGGSFSALLAGGGALATALEKQDDQALKEALQANPKLSGCALSLRDGNTASHFAAAEGRLDYLKILAETYDDGRKKRGKKHGEKYTARMLNRRNLNGQTTLMLACKYGHSEVVTWLLQLGGNPLLFDAIHSRTCLHYAALYGHQSCVTALFANDAFVKMPAGPLLLRDATVWDNQGHHKFVDARAALGFTAIHMSASQGHWQVVSELLKNDASLAVQCQGVLRSHIRSPPRWRPNSTPLHIAAARGSTSMVRHMLHAMANKMLSDADCVDARQIRDVVEMRPIDIAASFGFPRITALLDPSRTPELLAYVTAGSGPMRLGTPSLSILMSRLLRSQLLDQLVAIETGLAARRTALTASARAPSMKTAIRRHSSVMTAGSPVNQAGMAPLLAAPSVTQSPGEASDPFGASGALRMLSIVARQSPPQLPRQQASQPTCQPLLQPQTPLLTRGASPQVHAPVQPLQSTSIASDDAAAAESVQSDGTHVTSQHTDAPVPAVWQMQSMQSSLEPLAQTADNTGNSTTNSTAGSVVELLHQAAPGHVRAVSSAPVTERNGDGSSSEGEEPLHEEEDEEEEPRRRNSLVRVSIRRVMPPGENSRASDNAITDNWSGRHQGPNQGPPLFSESPFMDAIAFRDSSVSGRDSRWQLGEQSAVEVSQARGIRSVAAVTGGTTAGGSGPDLERHSSVMQVRAGQEPYSVRRPSSRRLLQPIDNELVLDDRHGDSYCGRTRQSADTVDGDMADVSRRSGTSTYRLGASPVGPESLDADGSAVFAEMATRQGSVQFLVSRNSNVLTRTPSNASLAVEECDICFDAPLEAAIKACSHEMCVECLRGVCESDPDHTPRCPFCRSVIDRIVVAGARRPTYYPAPLPQHKEGGSAGSDQSAMGQLSLALDDVCDAVIAAQM